jgi:hypothetical protein
VSVAAPARMSTLKKQEQAAIEAVARHFSATWEKGPDATLTIARKRIAVEVVTIKEKIAGPPRLRFDKVVLRLVGDLQAALSELVPDGEAVVVTVTAPIRLSSKTTAALENKIRDRLARRSARSEIEDTINGNQVRVRFVKGVSGQSSKVIGFVHNPDPDAHVLLDIAQSLLRNISAAAGRRARSAKERWLIVSVDGGFIETYRQVYAQLSIATDFKKILIVLAGGRVETLTG